MQYCYRECSPLWVSPYLLLHGYKMQQVKIQLSSSSFSSSSLKCDPVTPNNIIIFRCHSLPQTRTPASLTTVQRSNMFLSYPNNSIDFAIFHCLELNTTQSPFAQYIICTPPFYWVCFFDFFIFFWFSAKKGSVAYKKSLFAKYLTR